MVTALCTPDFLSTALAKALASADNGAAALGILKYMRSQGLVGPDDETLAGMFPGHEGPDNTH